VICWCALSLAACGHKSGDATKSESKDAGSAAAAVAPIAMPTLGLDAVARFDFIWEAGSPAYAKAIAAYRAKARDWAAVRASCEAAIAKDPGHLDAHRLLASALAQSPAPADQAAAVEHLVTALGGDFYAYAPGIAKDPDLAAFLATPYGQSLTLLIEKIRADLAKRVPADLWIVARRSPFKWPKDFGTQPGTSRGEVYAYDAESKRYIRLTHTEHQAVGFVRAPSGGEIAVLGFDKIQRDKNDAAPPLVARGWVQVFDTAAWQPQGPRVTLPSAREIAVGYGAGDQLLVSTAQATDRWGLAAAAVSAVDRSTGKLVKVGTAPAVAVSFTLDEGRLVRSPDGVTATWAGEPPTASSLKTAAGAAIAVPESGQASAASIAVAPDGAHVAFATAVDPCAKDAAPSLYVADGKTGALKHVLTAKSRFGTRWLDANRLAYEDADGTIRIWDATTGRAAEKLDDKAGMALDALSLSPAPLCKQAPPTAAAAGSGGSDDSLPPEEGAGPAPGGGAGAGGGSGAAGATIGSGSSAP